jgi:hypothetical protein
MAGRQLLTLLAVFSAGASAQWVNYPTPGAPRTKDGKVILTAPAPRAIDGKPDLSGVWMHEITPVAEVKRLFGSRFDDEITLSPPGMEIGTQHKYAFDIFIDLKPGEAPIRPETQKLIRQRAANRNSANVCAGTGSFPRNGLLSEPIKIIQAPNMTMLLYEAGYLHRQIYTDGRKLPKEFDLPAYLGYSVGHWERDTFVVETAGFNDKGTLDSMGRPRSEDMRITERFRRRDYGHMDVEMTFDDPKYYTKPFTIKIPHDLLPDTDIFEMFCSENEKDRVHLQKN